MKIEKKLPLPALPVHLLKIWVFVQPTKTKSYTVSTIKRLAKSFSQIELDSPDSLHLLAQEFTDFLLSPEDLRALRYYKNCNGVEKPRPGLFWWEVGANLAAEVEMLTPEVEILTLEVEILVSNT